MRGRVQSAAPSAWLRSIRNCTTCRPRPVAHRRAATPLGRVVEIAEEVIIETGHVEFRDGVAAGHPEQKLPQRSFADVELDLGLDAQLIFAEMIGEDLRDRQLGQDLVGLNAQRKIRSGETIGKALRPAVRKAAFVASLSGNCSGETCDSPFASTTSSRTAPSLTMRK